MGKEQREEKAITKYDEARLAQNRALGMRGVDPIDIRPPSILLAQKLSDFSLMVDKNGKTAKIGEYFHTGKLAIFKTFECYFLYAAKSKYIDRRRPEEGEKDQYKTLGVLASDFSLFAMTFRSSALFCLSSLFGIAAANKRPMFSFLVRMETKEISGEKGTWLVPVCRIVKPEDDAEKLLLLEDQARAFEKRGEQMPQDEEGE